MRWIVCVVNQCFNNFHFIQKIYRINQFAVSGTPTGRGKVTVPEFALLAVALVVVTLQLT